MGTQLPVEVVQHDAGLDPDGSSFGIVLGNRV